MKRSKTNSNLPSRKPYQHRGAVVVYVAVSMAAFLGIAALAVDVGMLYSAQAEVQRTADASALAAAQVLLDENRLRGGAYLEDVMSESRTEAVDVALRNSVLRTGSVLVASEDMEFGYMADLPLGDFNPASAEPPNAVSISMRRDSDRGGSIAMFFANMFGVSTRGLDAQATAAFADGIVGYKITPRSGNAQLLPFALHVDSWEGLIAGVTHNGDDYSYDPDTGSVSNGPDGILELNLYPGAGSNQLPPGNFGTVDIGSNNNSSADIARQILYGINESDLSYFGGELRLGADGTLLLNGDTGLSAGFKDELEAIKGQPRAIPIFSQVSGNGNNSMYTIVAFAGIRIMHVQLTGKMTSKCVIIQPAVVVDDAAIADPGPGPSYYVYRPVQLVR